MLLRTQTRHIVLLVLGVLFFTSFPNYDISADITERTDTSDLMSESPTEPVRYGVHTTSEVAPLVRAGVMSPVELEHQGYVVSPNTSVRSDVNPNIYYDLPLDATHSWIGSTADVEIYGMRKIYAINGTFNNGTPGINYVPHGNVLYHPLSWDALSNSTQSGQNQTASYETIGTQYVTVENWGTKIGPSGKKFTHYAGTRILWYQDISNQPYSDHFVASFSYLYARGPLGPLTPGACSIKLFVDGTVVWSQNLPSLEARNIWYSTDEISFNVTGLGSQFRVMIGLVIDADMALDADAKYDGTTPNGIVNTAYITAYLDNVFMIGQTAPSFDEVDLRFTAGDQTVPIVGSGGNGHASVVFTPYWDTDPLRIVISSNNTITYSYRARMYAHHFVNSTWNTLITNQGVAYTADIRCVNISFYFYVGTIGEYEDFFIFIRLPHDWSNVTVLDPLQYDITDSCLMMRGLVVIPHEAITLFGWWMIRLQAPNYAESIEVQKYNTVTGEWTTTSQYRSGNITRAQLVIGSEGQHPSVVTGVEVTWRQPDDTIWASQQLDGSGTQLNSSRLTLGPINTTAGRWLVDVFWSNGTEIALGRASFEVIHRATLIPLNEDIATTKGFVITNFVIFRDIDNGRYIMNETASVVASFRGIDVLFLPNLVRNWWEGDFNTSLLDYGVTHVYVNASLDYYDPSSCEFTITIPYPTTLEFTIANGQWLTGYIGEAIFIDFTYSLWNGSGLNMANFTLVYQGPTGGLGWYITEHTPIGNYTLTLIAYTSGVYEVTLQALKAGQESASDTLLLSVAVYNTRLSLPNGSLAQIYFGENYTLFIRYTNGSDVGIEGATVVITCSPSENITVGPVVDLGDGYYSVLLIPHGAVTFSVSIDVMSPDYQRQFATFILDIYDIPTVLYYKISSHTVAIDRNVTVTLLFTDNNGDPLSGATISVLDPPKGLEFTIPIDLGNGSYTLVIIPKYTGVYAITLCASSSAYRLSLVSIQLSIVQVPTTASAIGSGVVEFGSTYKLLLHYNRTDDMTPIGGANITVSSDSPGLSYQYVEVTEGYEIHFRTDVPGSWYIHIMVSKANHSSQLVHFILTVTTVPTRISVALPANSLYIDRVYSLNISLLMQNDTGVDQATVSFTRDMTEWFTFEPLGNGRYMITFAPTSKGTFTTVILLERVGHQIQQYEFVYTIYAVPCMILMDAPVWHQGQSLVLSLVLVESDTRQPVANATVEYRLKDGARIVASGQLDYAGAGLYMTQVNLNWIDSRSLSVSFIVTKEDYQIEGVTEWQVTAEPDVYVSTLTNFATFGLPPIVLITTVLVARQVRITIRARRDAERAENLRIRGRFRDAHNILGILVLHKTSGLPVYSRSLKIALDEGIISGLISAITSFRGEIQAEQPQWEFSVFPISDIILDHI